MTHPSGPGNPGTAAAAPRHRPVGTVELFFDLVFVFAISQVSGLVHSEEGPLAILRAGIVFAVIYWLWAVTAIQASFHDVSRTRVRLTLFATTFVALVVALCIPTLFEDTARAAVFAVSYWLGRLAILIGLLRGSWRTFGLYAVALTVSGPLLLVGAFIPSPGRELVWGLVALVEIVVPRLQRERMKDLRYDAEHVVERFGLLVLIALGESIIATGEPMADRSSWDWHVVGALASSCVLIAALWWLYFDHSDRLILRRVEAASVPFDAVRTLLAYGHLFVVGGVIAVAAGLHEVVAHPEEPLDLDVALLLSGGVVVYLFVFVEARFRAFHEVYRSRLAGSLGLLVVVPATTTLPGVGGLAVVTAVVVAIASWESVAPSSAGIPDDDDFARAS